jgi:legume-like lectin family protein
VIQNYGIPVVGPPAGYLGYHGLPNSLAIEFDTWLNYEAGFFDPNFNHVSVHSRGVAGNSVSEAASLGRTTAIPFLKDGAVHQARISYIPGTLQVFVDNLALPSLTLSGLDLSSLLRLDNGAAWVGFTAGTGSAYEAHDVLSWQFGGNAYPLPGGVTLPVTTTPSNPMPPTPTTPYILPPPPSTTPTTGTTQPPFTFPPYP